MLGFELLLAVAILSQIFFVQKSLQIPGTSLLPKSMGSIFSPERLLAEQPRSRSLPIVLVCPGRFYLTRIGQYVELGLSRHRQRA